VSESTTDALIRVAVPVPVDGDFVYFVPASFGVLPIAGMRVLVPFGSRTLVGVVRPGPAVFPTRTQPKPIIDILDHGDRPSIDTELVRVCEWMQDYYVACPGEVYRCALPGLLAGTDTRTVTLNLAGRAALASADGPLLGPAALTPDARRVLAWIADRKNPVDLAELIRMRPRVHRAINIVSELASEGLCTIEWIDAPETSRTEAHYRRTDWLRGHSADEHEIQKLVGRSKQRRALLDHLEMYGDWVSHGELKGPFRRLHALMEPLVAAGLVVVEARPRELDPFSASVSIDDSHVELTADQSSACEALIADLDGGRFVRTLLHGITGSGKTEVYLRWIARVRKHGRSAIVLVPEIALTPQLSERFRARFGGEVAVLHSGLTPRQRLDAWHQIRDGQRPIVIGARSAVFAPVPSLGIIVVDEEHDASFKQEDGVRYHARDVAVLRAHEQGAAVVLGSATPSLETYEAARSGRARYLELRMRPTPRPLPDVELVPLSVHRPDPESLMTGRLRQAVLETVAAGEQVILFLNRRGFSTTIVCSSCGSMVSCPDCSASSMTYHLGRNRLVCHWCGHIEATPRTCIRCGSEDLGHIGSGTERVELALERQLAQVRVLRLDRDTTQGRRLLATLARFRAHQADVLVGTQMLAKGHDFPGVTLVGILQADHGLGLPDPRAAERTFQLLTQVAGRAGRGARPGRVLVQAHAIAHPSVRYATRHDFHGFAAQELEARRSIGNPPFGHLALVRVHGRDPGRVRTRAHELAGVLDQAIGQVLSRHADEPSSVIVRLGPVPSPLERISGRTRWQLLVRARERGMLRWVLKVLRPGLGASGSGSRQTWALVDVDPQGLL